MVTNIPPLQVAYHNDVISHVIYFSLWAADPPEQLSSTHLQNCHHKGRVGDGNHPPALKCSLLEVAQPPAIHTPISQGKQPARPNSRRQEKVIVLLCSGRQGEAELGLISLSSAYHKATFYIEMQGQLSWGRGLHQWHLSLEGLYPCR